MGRCKDCVHFGICKKGFPWADGKGGGWCEDFKNKANVIEVIRCANCKHRKKGVFRAVDNLVYWQCEKYNVEILLTDYCSYGEKEC